MSNNIHRTYNVDCRYSMIQLVLLQVIGCGCGFTLILLVTLPEITLYRSGWRESTGGYSTICRLCMVVSWIVLNGTGHRPLLTKIDLSILLRTIVDGCDLHCIWFKSGYKWHHRLQWHHLWTRQYVYWHCGGGRLQPARQGDCPCMSCSTEWEYIKKYRKNDLLALH